MPKGILSMIERHVEKGILGLAGVFVLWTAWAYLINSPNKVKFEGQELSPGQLNEAILEAARRMDSQIKSARPEEIKIESFSRELRAQHEGGIFAAAPEAARQLPLQRLPRMGMFGSAIELPGLEESEEASVRLVTPLPPSKPVAITDRSLLIPGATPEISIEQASSAQVATAGGTPVETPWASVAAYFDMGAQREEMLKSQYANFRARVYVVGVDVQRQEMQSDGQWSEWKDVQGTKLMPDVEIPEPVFDDETKALMNKDEIDKMFAIVKAEQKTLMQPDFPPVEAGGFWETPPLPGLAVEEEEEETAVVRRPQEPRQPARAPQPPPIYTGPRDAQPGGRFGDTIGGKGGGGDLLGGSGQSAFSSARQEAEAKREGRKQARQDLSEAGRAFGQRDYPKAREYASRVANNQYANSGDKRKAEKLLERVDKAIQREQARIAGATPGTRVPFGPTGFGGDPRMPGGVMDEGGALGKGGVMDVISEGGMDPRGGGRGMSPNYGPTVAREAAPLVTHPDKPQTAAVWFHDDTVESGKTYRYRMRVALWNRYVGRKRALVDPTEANSAVIKGEWSVPSDPITVTPKAYFFLVGPNTERDGVRTEVWTWRNGFWLKEQFDARVGDVVGGEKVTKTGEWDESGEVRAPVDFSTGAVVLDIREAPITVRLPGKGGSFTHRQTTTWIMTYIDPADGQVKERVQEFDRNDPIREKLKDESFL